MFMKNFTKAKRYLTSAITQKIQNICNHLVEGQKIQNLTIIQIA